MANEFPFSCSLHGGEVGSVWVWGGVVKHWVRLLAFHLFGSEAAMVCRRCVGGSVSSECVWWGFTGPPYLLLTVEQAEPFLWDSEGG